MNKKLNKEEYNDFIKGIEFTDIRVDELSFKRFDIDKSSIKEDTPASITLKPTKNEYKLLKDNRCDVKSSILFRIEAEKNKVFELKVKFRLIYKCKVPINNEIFEVFSKRNIPFNIFPFLREIIHNSMYRAGLPPFLVPFLKKTGEVTD